MNIKYEIKQLKEGQRKNSETIKKIIDINEKAIKINEKSFHGHNKQLDILYKSDDVILDVFKNTLNIIKGLSFIINILLWRVFLWDPAKKLLNLIFKNFMSLPEVYKILVLGIIGTFLATLGANLLTNYIVKKFSKSKK